MYCIRCGAKLSDDAEICVKCGNLVLRDTNQSNTKMIPDKNDDSHDTEQKLDQFQNNLPNDINKLKSTNFKRIVICFSLISLISICILIYFLLNNKTTKIELPQFDMVKIPSGSFSMGSSVAPALLGDTMDGYSYEKPEHIVEIDSFYLGKYEVTQGLWQAVMENNPSKYSHLGADFPVECVSWNDCQQFIDKLNLLSKKKYRLPTEAEWEYACRAGSNELRYGHLDQIAWYGGISYYTGLNTYKVGRNRPNAFGLYDMLGNVREWCSDWFDENYYSVSPKRNPQGPSSGTDRVNRGGGFGNNAIYVYAAHRFHTPPDWRGGFDIGLRLACSLDKKELSEEMRRKTINAKQASSNLSPPPLTSDQLNDLIKQSVEVSENKKPNKLFMVNPTYPDVARVARIQGVVKIEVIIDVNGYVRQTKFISGHPLLNDSALNACKHLKYTPYLLNGKIMPAKFVESVIFNLDNNKCYFK